MTQSQSLLLAQVRARVGTWLRGKWRIDGLLGLGGMAAVYSATHRNGHRCAIKMLLPSFTGDADVVQRFAKEGYAANGVSHPGVVTVLDDDVTEDGACFLVMELLGGESLDRVLRKDQRPDPAEVMRIAHEVLDVLAAAHARGIVHRDIKPENVFVLDDGRIKVLDFGIARLRQTPADGGATKHGSVMGTPAFMPPEQARGHWSEVDEQSDLWSVGAVMFVALAGRPLRAAPTPNEELLLAMTEPPPPLISVAPEVPIPLADVVDRALRFDKQLRWRTARDMQAALGAVLGERAPTLHQPRDRRDHPPPNDAITATSGPTEAILAATRSEPAAARLVRPETASAPTRPRPRWPGIAAVTVVGGTVVALGMSRAAREHTPPPASESERSTARTEISSARMESPVTAVPSIGVPPVASPASAVASAAAPSTGPSSVAIPKVALPAPTGRPRAVSPSAARRPETAVAPKPAATAPSPDPLGQRL